MADDNPDPVGLHWFAWARNLAHTPPVLDVIAPQEENLSLSLRNNLRPNSPSPEVSPDQPTAVMRQGAIEPFAPNPDLPEIPGYELMSVIGSGGMGLVYKARHTQLRRTVAIKMLRGHGLTDPEFQQRFRAEAATVAKLQHPNVIQVFEVGTVPNPDSPKQRLPFIVLEFVNGGSLAQFVGRPQPPAYVAGLIQKLAGAVQAAHELGIIHRDLKPSNVLLTRELEPKIADFGIAKQIGADSDRVHRLETQVGTIVGTPEYMAPEQATGDGATPAVDVYALGVILYEMLTGRVPFQAATALETIDLVRKADIVPPSRLQPGLPRDLETICLKCLEKDPHRRYATARALANDLDSYLSLRPILARRMGPVEKATRWCRRNPLPAVSVLGTVMVVVLAFGLITASYWRSQEARFNAETSKAEAEEKKRSERWERYRANMVAASSSMHAFEGEIAQRMLKDAPDEHRNWEWSYLSSQLDQSTRSFRISEPQWLSNDGQLVSSISDKAEVIYDVANGKKVLACDTRSHRCGFNQSGTSYWDYSKNDKVLDVFNTYSKKNLLRLSHEASIDAVFSLGQTNRILIITKDGQFYVWGTDGKLINKSRPKVGNFENMIVGQDGRLALQRRPKDGRIAVLDLVTGQTIASLGGFTSELFLYAVNPDSTRLVTAEAFPANKVNMWDLKTGQLIAEMGTHENSINTIEFNRDGTRVATSSRDHTIGLWDGNGKPVRRIEEHRGWVTIATFNPDGSRFATGSRDNTIRIWDSNTGKQVCVLQGHRAEILRLAYSADGKSLVSVSSDGFVRTWDVRSAEADGRLQGHSTFVYGVAFHPDGKLVASASWDGTARIWDIAALKSIHVLDHGPKAIVTSVAFHPDGKILATRCRTDTRLWDVATGKEIHRWSIPSGGWQDTRIVFSPDGTMVATGCESRMIRIWDVKTKAELFALAGHNNEIRDVAFSPDGKFLVSVADYSDHDVRVWDLATGKQIHRMPGHTGPPYSTAFRGDGTLLATGGTDGIVRLWDTKTWTQRAELPHGVNVYGLAFSPDKDWTRLATACADGTIRLWDVATGQEVGVLDGHRQYVHQIAFSPDGSTIVSASGDGTLRVWTTK